MRRRWRWLVAAVVALGGLAVACSYLIDEPLRARIEANMNAALSGYRVRIGRADFHPLGFGIDLLDVTVFQDATPDTPIAEVQELSASVQWRALVFGGVVADVVFDHPTLHLDLRQAKAEEENPTPVKQRGWQEAIESIYPLEINELRILAGDVTYVPAKPLQPVRLTDLWARATNIRNVRSPNRTYPSELWLTATVGDSTGLAVNGHADFLAEPFAAVNLYADVRDLQLGYVSPVLQRYNVTARKGTLSTWGTLEYGPKIAAARLQQLTMTGVDMDYFHTAATAPKETERAEAGVRAARQQVTEPTMAIRVDEIRIGDSTLGYVDRSTDPPYRVFLDTETFTVQNFSNQLHEGDAKARLRGRFMGNGPTRLEATFRQQTHGPNFDMDLRIQNANLTSMNDLWRAYAGFDVAHGGFSLFTQIGVRDRRVQGYIKPIFSEVQIFDPEQESGKGFVHQVYEGLLGGIAWVLENKFEGDIATKTTISGTLENPSTSTLQVILGVVQNAFFKAILPGLERERGGAR